MTTSLGGWGVGGLFLFVRSTWCLHLCFLYMLPFLVFSSIVVSFIPLLHAIAPSCFLMCNLPSISLTKIYDMPSSLILWLVSWRTIRISWWSNKLKIWLLL